MGLWLAVGAPAIEEPIGGIDIYIYFFFVTIFGDHDFSQTFFATTTAYSCVRINIT